MSKSKTKSPKKISGKNRLLQIIVVVVLIAFAGYFIFSNIFKSNDNNNDLKKAMDNKTTFSFTKEGELEFIKPDGNKISEIDVEIADNDAQRAMGMMFRTEMKDSQGMLFIFPYETEQSFWMKNTVLALDMIFVNSNNEIVKIHHNTTPFSEQSYPSEKPAVYVIEVNAGYTNKMGIKEGDKIIFKKY